jgi:hypothetical protein
MSSFAVSLVRPTQVEEEEISRPVPSDITVCPVSTPCVFLFRGHVFAVRNPAGKHIFHMHDPIKLVSSPGDDRKTPSPTAFLGTPKERYATPTCSAISQMVADCSSLVFCISCFAFLEE